MVDEGRLKVEKFNGENLVMEDANGGLSILERLMEANGRKNQETRNYGR